MHHHVIHISPWNKEMMPLTNKNLSFWSRKIAFYVNRKQKSYRQEVFNKYGTIFKMILSWRTWNNIYVTSSMVLLTWHLLQRISLCSTRANMTTRPLNTSQPSIYRTFWSQLDHCTYLKGLLKATNVEVCEGIHPQLQYVCVQQHHAINHMVYYNHSQFLKIHCHFFLWTSS